MKNATCVCGAASPRYVAQLAWTAKSRFRATEVHLRVQELRWFNTMHPLCSQCRADWERRIGLRQRIVNRSTIGGLALLALFLGIIALGSTSLDSAGLLATAALVVLLLGFVLLMTSQLLIWLAKGQYPVQLRGIMRRDVVLHGIFEMFEYENGVLRAMS